MALKSTPALKPSLGKETVKPERGHGPRAAHDKETVSLGDQKIHADGLSILLLTVVSFPCTLVDVADGVQSEQHDHDQQTAALSEKTVGLCGQVEKAVPGTKTEASSPLIPAVVEHPVISSNDNSILHGKLTLLANQTAVLGEVTVGLGERDGKDAAARVQMGQHDLGQQTAAPSEKTVGLCGQGGKAVPGTKTEMLSELIPAAIEHHMASSDDILTVHSELTLLGNQTAVLGEAAADPGDRNGEVVASSKEEEKEASVKSHSDGLERSVVDLTCRPSATTTERVLLFVESEEQVDQRQKDLTRWYNNFIHRYRTAKQEKARNFVSEEDSLTGPPLIGKGKKSSKKHKRVVRVTSDVQGRSVESSASTSSTTNLQVCLQSTEQTSKDLQQKTSLAWWEKYDNPEDLLSPTVFNVRATSISRLLASVELIDRECKEPFWWQRYDISTTKPQRKSTTASARRMREYRRTAWWESSRFRATEAIENHLLELKKAFPSGMSYSKPSLWFEVGGQTKAVVMKEGVAKGETETKETAASTEETAPAKGTTSAKTASIEETVATKEAASTGETVATQEASAAEETVVAEETASTKETAATEKAAVTEETTATEETIVAEKTASIKKTAATEEIVSAEKTAATEEAPAAEEIVVAGETAAAEGTAVVEETVVVEGITDGNDENDEQPAVEGIDGKRVRQPATEGIAGKENEQSTAEKNAGEKNEQHAARGVVSEKSEQPAIEGRKGKKALTVVFNESCGAKWAAKGQDEVVVTKKKSKLRKGLDFLGRCLCIR